MPDKPHRPQMEDTEVAIAERVFARLKRRNTLWYAVSLVVALIVGGSLGWREATLKELSDSRIAEYRRLLTEKLGELHRLDLEAAGYRTRVKETCAKPLSRKDVEFLLASRMEATPEPSLVGLVRQEASTFGICDPQRIRHVFQDEANLAKVDAVFRLILKRPADIPGLFHYSHWLESGMDLEAVTRDLMASPEFETLRRSGDWHQKALADLTAAGVSEYRLLVADKLEERHASDLDEVARRTKRARDCPAPLARGAVERLLESELGWSPQEKEVDEIISKAQELGLCELAHIKYIYDDAATMAAIDTLYRILLRRPADPFGRLIYGYWKTRGVDIEVAARDIMSSSEFQKLRKLGEP